MDEGDRKSIAGAIEEVMDKTSTAAPDPENPDYVGEDGLLYCGICHTRKQVRLKLPESLFGGSGTAKVVPCLCRHRSEELKKKREAEDFKQQMLRIQRMKDASLMESAYREATFEGFKETAENRKAERIARKYCENFRDMYEKNQGLLLYGPVGTGKSFTAACIANRLMDSMTSVIMTSTVKLIQNMSGFSRREELQGYMKTLDSPQLLILDDLGAERNSDFAIEQIYNVVDARSRSGKPLIVTTNVPLSEMMHTPDIRYRRIYDRILANCYPAEIAGRSFRMMSAETRFDEMKKILE